MIGKARFELIGGGHVVHRHVSACVADAEAHREDFHSPGIGFTGIVPPASSLRRAYLLGCSSVSVLTHRGMAASRNYSVDSVSFGIWSRMKPQPVQTKPSAENPPPRITLESSSRRTIPFGRVSHSMLLQKGQTTAVGIAPLSSRDKPNGLRSDKRLAKPTEHYKVGVNWPEASDRSLGNFGPVGHRG